MMSRCQEYAQAAKQTKILLLSVVWCLFTSFMIGVEQQIILLHLLANKQNGLSHSFDILQKRYRKIKSLRNRAIVWG